MISIRRRALVPMECRPLVPRRRLHKGNSAFIPIDRPSLMRIARRPHPKRRPPVPIRRPPVPIRRPPVPIRRPPVPIRRPRPITITRSATPAAHPPARHRPRRHRRRHRWRHANGASNAYDANHHRHHRTPAHRGGPLYDASGAHHPCATTPSALRRVTARPPRHTDGAQLLSTGRRSCRRRSCPCP